jgi:hypothetical protein
MKCFVSIQCLDIRQSVGLLGRGISPSQSPYLHRINTNIHALSGIRTHDPSVHALDRAATVIDLLVLYY